MCLETTNTTKERKMSDWGDALEQLENAREKLANAARKYKEWAEASGDYPHDERGCEAHEAIITAISELDAL
jgi:hypothetical protein